MWHILGTVLPHNFLLVYWSWARAETFPSYELGSWKVLEFHRNLFAAATFFFVAVICHDFVTVPWHEGLCSCVKGWKRWRPSSVNAFVRYHWTYAEGGSVLLISHHKGRLSLLSGRAIAVAWKGCLGCCHMVGLFWSSWTDTALLLVWVLLEKVICSTRSSQIQWYEYNFLLSQPQHFALTKCFPRCFRSTCTRIYSQPLSQMKEHQKQRKSFLAQPLNYHPCKHDASRCDLF